MVYKRLGDPDKSTSGFLVLGVVFGPRALVQCWPSPFSVEATELPLPGGAIYCLGVFYSEKFLLIGPGLFPRAAGTDCLPSSMGLSSHVRTVALSSQSGPPQSMHPGPFSDLSAAFPWLQEHGAGDRGEGCGQTLSLLAGPPPDCTLPHLFCLSQSLLAGHLHGALQPPPAPASLLIINNKLSKNIK